MYGAILGDIIGSPYEFDMGNKTKSFPLFSERSTYTDDTVMTLAGAEAFLDAPEDESVLKKRLVDALHKYGKLCPDAGKAVCLRLHPEGFPEFFGGEFFQISLAEPAL